MLTHKISALFMVIAVATLLQGPLASADVTCQILKTDPSKISPPAPYEVYCGCKHRDETNFMVPSAGFAGALICDEKIHGWAGGEVASKADGYVTFKGDKVSLYDWAGYPAGHPKNPSDRQQNQIGVATPPEESVAVCLQAGEGIPFSYKVPSCNNQSVKLCAFSESCKEPLLKQIWQVCRANEHGDCPSFDECRSRNPTALKPGVSEMKSTPPPANPFEVKKDILLSYHSASRRLIQFEPKDFIVGCQAKGVNLCIAKSKLEKKLPEGDLVSLGDGGKQICTTTAELGCPLIKTCYEDKSVVIPAGPAVRVGSPTDNKAPGSGVAH